MLGWIKHRSKRKERKDFLDDIKNPEAKIEREINELLEKWAALILQDKNSEAHDTRIKIIELQIKLELQRKKKK